jgi:hypothetical protein
MLKKRVAVGQAQVISIVTAEPVAGPSVIEVRQPDLEPYLLEVTGVSPTRLVATWTVQPGPSGTASITVTTTDTDGGTQSREYAVTIE